MNTPQAFALALQHHQAGRLKEAETLYRQILFTEPNHADAWHYFGVLASQAGRHDVAVDYISRALTLNPDNPGAHVNLGWAYHSMRRLDEAMAAYRRALEFRPNFAEAHNNLGNALREHGQLDEAVAACRRALELRPDFPEACNNLGIALTKQGKLDEAVASLSRALQLNPSYPDAWNNLSAVLTDQERLDEAVSACRKALELKPDYPEGQNNLGHALLKQHKLDVAIAAYQRAVELKPTDKDIHNNLGAAFLKRGEVDKAIGAHRRALQLDPACPKTHSSLIFNLHYHPEQNHRIITEEQHRWNLQFSDPLKRSIRPHANVPDPHRPLKIGYVSPDFCSHPLTFFFAPLLEAHDHAGDKIYCYSSTRRPDAVTERLRKSADVWRDVRLLPDARLAECVRKDGIDILVDLAMHTAGNRLPALAHKPAPIQVSWLAYPGRTGLDAIDYRLTDARMDPEGQQDGGPGEEPVRLPDSWCCYAPIAEFPPVSPLPAAQTGTVTFGCLNQIWKMNEGLLACWARLLTAVPGSRLLMVCPEGRASERTRALLARDRIAPERVELILFRPWPEYLRLYERIDLALDTSPCNGMTTTCHALWMGVPVVTLAGASAVGRAGCSLLHAAGLPDWVAQDEESYIRVAANWAANLPGLAELRRALRSRMEASPLMNAPRFARNLEAVYRSMWHRWCTEHTLSSR